MMQKLKLVFTGTGACATGAYAQYVSQAGLQCGHEKIFGPFGYPKVLENLAKDNCLSAESSWLAAPYLDREELGEAIVVHLVRHPAKVIAAMGRMPIGAGRYWLFAAVWSQTLLELGHSWDGFAYRYVYWNRMIELRLTARGNHIFWKVDDADPLDLMEQLRSRGLNLRIDPNDPIYRKTGINRHMPKREAKPQYQFNLNKLRHSDIREDLEQIAERYGYEW